MPSLGANGSDGQGGPTAPNRQASLRRPPPPALSHTAPAPPTMMSPNLRQSAGFAPSDWGSDAPMPRSVNPLSAAKRYSDDGRDPKSSMIRKKSGFSSFMNSVLGSPRRINISNPENPVHVTHVGYDNETGQFTVCSPPPSCSVVLLAPR